MRSAGSRGRKAQWLASRPALVGAALFVCTLVMTGLVGAGCGSGDLSRSSSTEQRVQLVYQDWRTEWFPPMAQKELTIFQAEHPNLSVFYTPDPENLADQMPLDMQAGNAADVFQGCCEFFPVWNQKGYVLDLREYVETDLDQAIVADWDPVQYEAFFDASGRQFGVPKYHGTLALYYNKDIFDKYGRRLSRRLLDPRRLPRGHEAADSRHQRRRQDRHLGQHDRHLVGPAAGARQCLGGHIVIPAIRPSASSIAPRRWQLWSGCAPACGTTR